LPDRRREGQQAGGKTPGGPRPTRRLALPFPVRVCPGLPEEPDSDSRHQQAQARKADEPAEMIVDVATLPSAAVTVERKVAIVVDALRASATLTAMFDAGASSVIVAADPDEAFTIVGDERKRYLICGESGGVPPAGFDYG